MEAGNDKKQRFLIKAGNDLKKTRQRETIIKRSNMNKLETTKKRCGRFRRTLSELVTGLHYIIRGLK